MDKKISSDILDLAKRFIFAPTSKDNPLALKYIILDAKDKLNGFKCEDFLSNDLESILVYNAAKRPDKFRVILNAHLDVVEGQEDQFTPYVKNGRLYGRGAYDMKASAAVMLLLFKEIAPKVSYQLGLQLTTDEESNGQNCTRYQIQQGVRADFVIMGECGSNFNIINEAKASISIKLTARGKSAHGAYPWKGENAIWKMHNALDLIMKHYPIPSEKSYDTTINIGKIESQNNAINRVPDNCSAYLDIRIPIKDKNTMLDKLRSIVPKDIVIEPTSHFAYHYTDPENEFIKKLKSISENILGNNVNITKQYATSDARFYSEVGCAAVEFGPVGAGQHQDEEWVDIESLNKYYQILKEFLLSID